MHSKLHPILLLLKSCLNTADLISPAGGEYVYQQSAFILFFIIMMIKKVHKKKAMARYAKAHFAEFGWEKAPSRQTIRRRFKQLPLVLQWLMPEVAIAAGDLDERFKFRFGFIDKTIFRALGGLWHKKDIKIGRVPHPGIDTDASWGKSAYHGWRFGYGLHMIVNKFRFPLAVSVTTAKVKDETQVTGMARQLKNQLLVLVGDKGYQAIRVVWQVWQGHQVFLLTNAVYKTFSKYKDWYNQTLERMDFNWLYFQRKPSVEPAFSLVKELFDLKGQSQLPYKGLNMVVPYLMITAITVQLMMIYNAIHEYPLGCTTEFKTINGG
jgi:hypothetical protein